MVYFSIGEVWVRLWLDMVSLGCLNLNFLEKTHFCIIYVAMSLHPIYQSYIYLYCLSLASIDKSIAYQLIESL